MSPASYEVVLRPPTALEVPAVAAQTFPAYREMWLAGAPLCALAAFDGGHPVGLALARVPEGPDVEVLSLYVRPAVRGRGVGGRLLLALGDILRERGVRTATGSYVTGTASTPSLERVLAKCDWEPPTPSMLLFQGDLARVSRARWLRSAVLSSDFELFDWVRRTEADRAEVAQGLGPQGWIPEDLRPSRHEDGFEPRTSLGLRRDGRLVGWALTHELAPDLLRFSSGWVHPSLQRRGRLFALYAESGRRALTLGYTRTSWMVPFHHASKATFARRWMAPVARCRETRESRKQLVRTRATKGRGLA